MRPSRQPRQGAGGGRWPWRRPTRWRRGWRGEGGAWDCPVACCDGSSFHRLMLPPAVAAIRPVVFRLFQRGPGSRRHPRRAGTTGIRDNAAWASGGSWSARSGAWTSMQRKGGARHDQPLERWPEDRIEDQHLILPRPAEPHAGPPRRLLDGRQMPAGPGRLRVGLVGLAPRLEGGSHAAISGPPCGRAPGRSRIRPHRPSAVPPGTRVTGESRPR